jgi:molybdopterin converting factor small subunit
LRVTVKLSSAFKQYSPTDSLKFTVNIEDEATILSLTYKIGIPSEVSWLPSVNGRHAEKSTLLNEGDTITIHPLVGGG